MKSTSSFLSWLAIDLLLGGILGIVYAIIEQRPDPIGIFLVTGLIGFVSSLPIDILHRMLASSRKKERRPHH